MNDDVGCPIVGIILWALAIGVAVLLIVVILNGVQDQAACKALDGRYAHGVCYEKSPKITLP